LLVVTHTAGKEPKPIDAKQRPADGIYSFKTFKSQPRKAAEADLNGLLFEATEWISSKGPDAGASISHAIDTRDSSLVVAAISWHHIHESNLKETAQRPSECACNLF
jgi:hypothetical protein